MPTLDPGSINVDAVAGWINRELEKVIADLKAENQVLKGKIKGRGRLRFSDGQRCRLGAKAKDLGRAASKKLGYIISTRHAPSWNDTTTNITSLVLTFDSAPVFTGYVAVYRMR